MAKHNDDAGVSAVDPKIAARMAEAAVKIAQDVYGVDLDFTPNTLERLDSILERTRLEGCSAEGSRHLQFGFGCYLGEVIARNLGGVWRATGETPMAKSTDNELVLELTSASVLLNPLGKVYKRLKNGEDDSVTAYYYFAVDMVKSRS